MPAPIAGAGNADDIDLSTFPQNEPENKNTPPADDDAAARAAADDGGTPPADNGEPQVVEQDGKKLVDLRALHAEREQRRALKQQLTDMQQLVVDLLAQTPAVADRGRDERADPKLVEIAETLGYYDASGQLDLKRAAKTRDLFRDEATEVVKPVAHDHASVAARQLRERAYQKVLDTDGDPVAAKEYIDAVLDTLPPALQAQPEVANLAMIIAAGLETIDARKQGRSVRRSTSRGPIFTESGARRGGGINAPTPIEQAAMRARGKSPEQWSKLSKEADNDVLESI